MLPPRSAINPHGALRTWLLPIASGVVLVIAYGYALGWAFVQGIGTDDPLQYDLDIYRAAIAERAAGHSLYDYATDVGDVFNYPPFAALVLWPLYWIGKQASAVVWTALTLVSATLMVVVLHRSAQGRRQRRHFPLFAVVLALVLVSSANLSTLLWGQLGALLTVLALVDALGHPSRRFGGALVGLLGAIKLAPLMFIPYFLLGRRYREAATASATFAGSTLLAWAVFPSDSRRYWFSETFQVRKRVWDIADVANQSLYSFVLRFKLDGPTTAVVFGASAVTALAMWGLWTRRLQTRDPVLAVIITGCAWLLLEPVTWVHHMYWPVLAGAWLVLNYRGLPRWAGAAVLLLMLRPMAWEQAPRQDNVWDLLYINSWLAVVIATIAVLPLLVPRAGQNAKVPTPLQTEQSLARCDEWNSAK